MNIESWENDKCIKKNGYVFIQTVFPQEYNVSLVWAQIISAKTSGNRIMLA